MIIAILSVLALFVIQTLLPASIRYFGGGAGLGRRLLIALGPRDEQPPLTPIAQRAQRALTNLQEALPVFLTIALVHVILGTPQAPAIHGAWVFFLARVVYVPAYLSGILGLRSVMWGVSWVGLVMMLAALFQASTWW